MVRFLTMISLVLAISSPARAEIHETVENYQDELRTMVMTQDARWGFYNAKTTLQTAFEAGGVVWAQRYVNSWSGWLWIEWASTGELYAAAERGLNDWGYAVTNGQADVSEVEAMLERGMIRLRRVHSRMSVWFEDDLEQTVERARWLDRANEICCDEALRNYYYDRADRAEDDSIAPDYTMIGRIKVFPAVPEAGGVPPLPQPDLSDMEARAAEAFAANDTKMIRRHIRTAQLYLSLSDDMEFVELARVLRLIGERLEYDAEPVAELLVRARDLPEGPLREEMFQQAEDALLDRIGHLSEVLASSAASPEERESVRSALLANAKRLAQLVDDARFEFRRPSGVSRLFAGLSAASHSLDAGRRGDLRGAELAEILQDVSDSFPTPVSPVAPFSGPMGAVAAQVDDVRSGFELAAQALEGIGDAISGDGEGVTRALDAARGLKEVLSPKRFAQSITRGFVKGVISNVPFARSVYDWVNR